MSDYTVSLGQLNYVHDLPTWVCALEIAFFTMHPNAATTFWLPLTKDFLPTSSKPFHSGVASQDYIDGVDNHAGPCFYNFCF